MDNEKSVAPRVGIGGLPQCVEPRRRYFARDVKIAESGSETQAGRCFERFGLFDQREQVLRRGRCEGEPACVDHTMPRSARRISSSQWRRSRIRWINGVSSTPPTNSKSPPAYSPKIPANTLPPL